MELFSEMALCQYYAMTVWTIVTAFFFKEVYSITNRQASAGEASAPADKISYTCFTIPAKQIGAKSERASRDTFASIQVFSKFKRLKLISQRVAPLTPADLKGISLNSEMRIAYL